MGRDIDQETNRVKMAGDVLDTMSRLDSRLSKEAVRPILEDALGFDDFAALRDPHDLSADELIRAKDVVDSALENIEAQSEFVSDPIDALMEKAIATQAAADFQKGEEFLRKDRPEMFSGFNESKDKTYTEQLPPLTDKEPRTIGKVTTLCNEWVWVVGAKRFISRRSGTMIDPMQFDSKYNSIAEKASISKQLFAELYPLRRFDHLAFRPGAPEVAGKYYNTWRPSPIKPVQGDTQAWDLHIDWLVPNEAERNLMLDWLAWVYQNQSSKPLYALLLVGPTFGIGKSFIARVMEYLIGKENTQRPKNSSIKGEFNGWAAKCRLCIIEELMAVGRHEVAHELRDMITEPTIEVNIKSVPAFLIENYTAMMGISNNPDALPIPKGDRRWLVITSSVTEDQKRQAIESGYFKKLMPIVDQDKPNVVALSAIAYQLANRDVSNFRPGDAPMTAGKETMIDLSAIPLETWLRDNRSNDPLTRSLVNIRDDILDKSIIPEKVLRENSSRNPESTIAKFLAAELDGVNIGSHRVGKGRAGKVVKLWAINDAGRGVKAKMEDGIEPRNAVRGAAAIYNDERAGAAKAVEVEADAAAREDFDEA